MRICITLNKILAVLRQHVSVFVPPASGLLKSLLDAKFTVFNLKNWTLRKPGSYFISVETCSLDKANLLLEVFIGGLS